MTHPILVTGAAGFAGRHVLPLLQTDGVRLIAWRRPRARAAPASARPGITWQDVEITNRHQVRNALAGCRPAVIVHCAGAAHVADAWRHSGRALAVNAIGTHYLLDAARQIVPAARVLLPGSALVYRPSDQPLREDDPLVPRDPYGLGKLAQELLGLHAVHDDGQPVLLTRSFNHTGPGQDPSFAAPGFARQIAEIEAGRAEAVIRVGNLDARRDVTDVRDVVQAYLAVLERGVPGRPYNVCTGRAIAIGEILDGLLALARVHVRVQIDPSLLRPVDTPLVIGNPERIRSELAWSPTIPLSRTLSDLLDHWRRLMA